MSEYKDRGIMKWAAFDSLSSIDNITEQTIFNMNKKQKTILSEDEYEEINETIIKATTEKKEITIEYYNKGYYYTTYGKIKNIDSVKKSILLDTKEEVLFEDIIDIKAVR